jgi:uncharacterized protein YjeT (DUF2065 family)
MRRSPGLLALGLFFVVCGIAMLVWSLRPLKEVPPGAKGREVRERAELNAENVKLRIAGAAAMAFGAVIAAIS